MRRPLALDSLSPLRYPGSKRKLIPAVSQLIEANYKQIDLFVEPFCGGASMALGLLHLGVVRHALIADSDPLVAAFWYQAATNPEGLIDQMDQQAVTLDTWDKWRFANPKSVRDQAMKCLFLNRTTFSGITCSGGPIGGRTQSKNKIDCRFNKTTLAARIRNVGRLFAEGRLLLPGWARWQETLRQAPVYARSLNARTVVEYLDPPYVEKAGRLYDRAFAVSDHEALAKSIIGDQRHWVLSYDDTPLTRDLYQGKPKVRQYSVLHQYVATGRRTKPTAGREVIYTNLPVIPD